MTVAEVREKCKSLVARVPRDASVLAVLVLASLFSFGLGFLAGLDARRGEGGIVIEESPAVLGGAVEPAARQGGEVVASKNGTKYYFTECVGAGRIAEANKVRFVSASAAMQAGYTLAANCAPR
ncbi:hypothetical protein HY972_00370 [Candidatus Kaiserbacteria bacterium]|nr:hypothetical protein [Candidatus Kaiserbacteria bacterium]